MRHERTRRAGYCQPVLVEALLASPPQAPAHMAPGVERRQERDAPAKGGDAHSPAKTGAAPARPQAQRERRRAERPDERHNAARRQLALAREYGKLLEHRAGAPTFRSGSLAIP